MTKTGIPLEKFAYHKMTNRGGIPLERFAYASKYIGIW